MKKTWLLAIPIYLIGIFYLSLPNAPYPDLSNSARSDEPGDTVQNPDQKAFYTNTHREEALSELQKGFDQKIFGITIPSYRLNYRPEETAEFVREQVKSSYLEEIIYPLRESLFVNGFEPQNYPRYANISPEKKPIIEFYNQPYYSKVTLRPVYSNLFARILVWTLIFPSVYFVYLSIKRSFSK